MHFDDMSFPKTRPQTQFHGKDGKKKFRSGSKMQAAMQEVLMRIQAGWRPDYERIAKKYDVNRGSLQTFIYRYRKERIDLRAPADSEPFGECNLEAELNRSLGLLTDYERHLNDTLEQLLTKAEAELKQGNLLAFEQLGIPKLVQQIAATTGLRAKREKGVLSILGELMEAQNRREQAQQKTNEPKPVNGSIVSTAISRSAFVQDIIRRTLSRPEDAGEQECLSSQIR